MLAGPRTCDAIHRLPPGVRRSPLDGPAQRCYPRSMDMNRFEERIERRREFWEWRRRHRSPLAGLFVGGCIVAVGVLLLLDNLGIRRLREPSDFWALILVVVGRRQI